MGEYEHASQNPLSGDQRSISHTTLTECSGHMSRSFTPLTDCACHSGTTDRSSVNSDSDICIRTISAELSTHAYAPRPCCHRKNAQSVLLTRKESCDFYIDRRLSDSRNIRSVKIIEQPLSRQSLMKMQSDYVLSSRAATVEHIRWQSLKHTGCSDCDWKTLKHRNSFENYHDRNFMKQSSYVNNDGDSLKQSNSFEICDGNSAKQRSCGNCESNSFNESNRSEDIDRNLSEQKHSCDKCNKKTLNQNSCRYCDRQNKPFRGNSNSNLLYTDKFIRTNEINHISVPALDFLSLPDDTSGNIDDQDPLSARLQRDQPSKVNFHICRPNCDGKVKAYKSTNNDLAGHCLNSGSGDNMPDVNNRRKSETLEMTDTINTFHICEPSCKGTPMESNEITDAICTLHVCEPNCKGIPDKPKEMKDAKYKLHLCGPDCNRIPNDSKEKKHTINKFHICEPNSAGTPVKSKAMTDTINTLHICEPSFRRIPLLPYRNALNSRCSGQSCSRAKDLKPRQTKGQCSAKAPTARSVDSQYFHVCKSPIGVKENTCTKSLLSNIQVVNTQPRYCNCDGNRHTSAAKEIMFKKENEIIPQTSAENSNEPLLSEDVVWIKRIDTDVLSHSEVKDKKLRSNGKRITHNDSRKMVILMFLTLIGSLLNPIIAPAGIYFLIRSKRAWSQGRYHTAYKFIYQASGIASIGIILTITSLVLFLAVKSRNHMETTTASQIRTSTSNENQDMSDIRYAGERFLDTLMDRPSSHKNDNMKQTSSGSRHIKRTSPRHLYTKIRHSTHGLRNIHISDFDKFLIDVTPTETTETTRAKHFNEFLNEDVAKRTPHLTFRNKTMSIYFDPKSKRTIIVNIPDFMQ